MKNTLRLVTALVALSCTACGQDTAGPADGDRFRPLFTTLYSNLRDPARLVAPDSVTWAAIWNTLSSGTPNSPPRPAVNFRDEEVVIVAMGERRKAGFSVRIEQIVYTDSSRNVIVLQTVPAESCSSAEVITAPLDAAALSKSSRPIRFLERVQIRSC